MSNYLFVNIRPESLSVLILRSEPQRRLVIPEIIVRSIVYCRYNIIYIGIQQILVEPRQKLNRKTTMRKQDFINTIERYVKYYNTQRPCFAIGYDTPENYRKRYYKGELPKKQTFENRVLSPEPKFVQKRRQLADSKDTYEDVSTFEKEIPEKS